MVKDFAVPRAYEGGGSEMMDSRRNAAGICGNNADKTPEQAAQRRRHRAKFAAAVAALIVALLVPRAGTAGLLQPTSRYLDETLQRFNCTASECADGAFPVTGVIVDRVGNIYGSAQYGSNGLPGLVFELQRNGRSWSETVLYNFCSQTNCTDGRYPNGLLADSSGNLYGTTVQGGAPGYGVVFELTPPTPPSTTWAYTQLYAFCSKSNCVDGANPWGKLTMDASGNLYGTTSNGGSQGLGAVFELTPNQSRTVWTENVLHNFCSQGGCADGANSFAGLLLDKAGNLYGATAYGGSFDVGTVFELTPPTPPSTTWTQAVLYSFQGCTDVCRDGVYPETPLLMDAAGNLYGTTLYGGPGGYCPTSIGCGTVFELTAPSQTTGSAWTESVIYSFCSQPNCADGRAYYSVNYFSYDADGGLQFGCGRLSLSAATSPACDHISLLGTTFAGGKVGCRFDVGCGVVFALTPNISKTIWTESVLYSFCSQKNCDDGDEPTGGVAADELGNLYGVTYLGGGTSSGFCANQGCGAVFKLVPSGGVVGPLLPVSTPPPASPPVMTAPSMPGRGSLDR
jgi:uncharacterized repeat protein (TIGR03803 family)